MKKVLSILCVFVLAIMLTACSKGMTGTYKLVEMSSGGEKVGEETLKTLGIQMELKIKDDKNAVLSMDGDEVELTYDGSTFTGKDLETGEVKSIPYKVDGNKIIITDTDEGEEMTFKK